MRRLLSQPSALPRCRALSTTLAWSSMTGTRGRHLGSQERNAPEQIEGPEQLLAVLGRLGRQGLHAQLLREVDRAQQAGAMDRRHYNAAVSSDLGLSASASPPPWPPLSPPPPTPDPRDCGPRRASCGGATAAAADGGRRDRARPHLVHGAAAPALTRTRTRTRTRTCCRRPCACSRAEATQRRLRDF